MTIDSALSYGIRMQESGVPCNGPVYKPIVQDIVLIVAKNNQPHTILIPGIENFTKRNIAQFTDHVID